MGNHQQSTWQRQLIFYSMIAMLAGIFLSRALLSISTIVFIVCAVVFTDLRQLVRTFRVSPELWSITLLFILPLLSGLWSDDTHLWLMNLRTKLPLLFFPLAFATGCGFRKLDWERLALVFAGCATAGALWSMSRYLGNAEAVHAGYLRSTLLTTPLENDHVRFSWMVALAILMSGWLLWEKRGTWKKAGWLVLLVVTLLLVLYLHLLAVRTGLAAFYAMVLILGIWLLRQQKTRRWALAILPGALLLAFAAFALLPTLQNRWRYVQYDYGFFSKAHYREGMNDAVRVISLKAGWSLMRQHAGGTGFGDLTKDTKDWYATHYPGMKEEDQILPGSEALVYGAACGWAGLLVFGAVLLLPFFLRKHVLWILVNIALLPGLVFDIALEVQFGVFLYAFTLLFFRGWVWQIKEEENKNGSSAPGILSPIGEKTD